MIFCSRKQLERDENCQLSFGPPGSVLQWMGTCYRRGKDKSISGSLRLGLILWFHIPEVLGRVVEDACVGHFRVLALAVSGSRVS